MYLHLIVYKPYALTSVTIVSLHHHKPLNAHLPGHYPLLMIYVRVVVLLDLYPRSIIHLLLLLLYHQVLYYLPLLLNITRLLNWT